MKTTQDISQIFRQMRATASSKLDERVHREIDMAMTPVATAPSEPQFTLGQIFALILKRQSARYTVATTLVLAVLVAFALFRPAPSAWAMEQTIEAIKKYRGLQMSGNITKDGKTYPLDLWARADVTGNWVQAALGKLGDEVTLWTRDNKTYTYVQEDKTVYDDPGVTLIDLNPWPGPTLLALLATEKDYQAMEGEDPATGRKRVIVTCSLENANGPQSFLLEFDVRTKLLVSSKSWLNATREGAPHCAFDKILYFEDLPDGVFNFQPPSGTLITNMSLTVSDVSLPALSDTNYGISAEGMTREQACQKIVGQYWAAAIKQDFARMRQLCPFVANLSDEFLREACKLNGIVQVMKVGGIEKTGVSKVGPLALAPIWVRDQDSVVSEIWMTVQFRETDQGTSCVIYGEHGYALNVKE